MKFFFFILIFVSCLELKAQTSFYCDKVDMCLFNRKTQKIEECSGVVDSKSFLIIDELKEVIIHKHANKEATFYIVNKNYNKDYKKNVDTYGLVDRGGTLYQLFLDLENSKLVLTDLTDRNNSILIVYFSIKNIY